MFDAISDQWPVKGYRKGHGPRIRVGINDWYELDGKQNRSERQHSRFRHRQEYNHVRKVLLTSSAACTPHMRYYRRHTRRYGIALQITRVRKHLLTKARFLRRKALGKDGRPRWARRLLRGSCRTVMSR